MRKTRHKRLGLPLLSGLGLLALAGCYGGVEGESLTSLGDRDIDQIPQPPDPTRLRAIELKPRDLFGAGNTAMNLAYQEALPDPTVTELFRTDLPSEERMNPGRPLMFFITPHTDEEGAGPLFNQRMCLGCHQSQEDIRTNNVEARSRTGNDLWAMPASLNTISTPVSRAGRQAPTDHSQITKDLRPPTAAFTLYGDFFPQTGVFDPISFLGGPLQHVKAVGECDMNRIPPESVDPNLRGGTDPVTGISVAGARREVGERAGPPYIGRGLIDSVYNGDLVANDDPADTFKGNSTLAPQPDPNVCPGDCVSGRHNENLDEGTGTEERVFRVGRFGLRAAGVTMLQFDTGGTQGEIGLTSPFSPAEQNNAQNVGRSCDRVPDPELVADVIRNLRSMIRMISPPRHAAELYEVNPAQGTLAWEVQQGAQLFGVDLDAFRSRVTPGVTPVNFGDRDADRGIASDRQLGCVSCHIPILRTGKSQANVGRQYLSERWAPLFSDLILHMVPQYPLVRRDRLSHTFDLERGYTISRNLADFANPAPVTGIALGNEFRTPPLAGIGKTGAPFMHDARVYLNILDPPAANPPPYRDGNPPPNFPYNNPTGVTVATCRPDPTDPNDQCPTTRGGINEDLRVVDLDSALLAAIEIHDLPAPPGPREIIAGNPTGRIRDDNCPAAYQDNRAYDLCRNDSPNRSEARNVMEKFRNLTRREQMYIVRFLESL
ncbi:MAG TPA: hypothetical protein VH877_32325 [Polyangia bacterium]|nr:hypothetical protein [Polyangia bacterium]